jgi:hypothetical protein
MQKKRDDSSLAPRAVHKLHFDNKGFWLTDFQSTKILISNKLEAPINKGYLIIMSIFLQNKLGIRIFAAMKFQDCQGNVVFPSKVKVYLTSFMDFLFFATRCSRHQILTIILSIILMMQAPQAIPDFSDEDIFQRFTMKSNPFLKSYSDFCNPKMGDS